jgi:integrase/recombinase XerD
MSSYASDLEAFRSFLEVQQKTKSPDWSRLTLEHLEEYAEHLKALGQKSNTRRRKLLTLRKLLRYLHGRKEFPLDVSRKLPTPSKLERKPQLLDYEALTRQLEKLPQGTELEQRNALLVAFLLETGALISEVAPLQWREWNKKSGEIHILGKRERTLLLSADLNERLRSWWDRVNEAGCPWIFSGHNRFGSRGGAVSTRGIELAIKQVASRLGVEELVPRLFRQCVISHWIRQGMESKKIQERLGLTSDYSLRVYFGHIQRSDHMN